MKPLKLKTDKLFYGKWPFRITFRVRGANLICLKSNLYMGELRIRRSYSNWRGHGRIVDNVGLKKFANLLLDYLDKELKFRMEYDDVQCYVKDPTLFKELQSVFKEYVTCVTEPHNEQELNYLLGNKKYVIRDKYPKDIYHYKVVLKPMPIALRENFYKWLCQYDESKVSITKSTVEHLTTAKHWWNDCYFYVADSSMLVMANLAAQGYIRRTEEYVLRSSINTET